MINGESTSAEDILVTDDEEVSARRGGSRRDGAATVSGEGGGGGCIPRGSASKGNMQGQSGGVSGPKGNK